MKHILCKISLLIFLTLFSTLTAAKTIYFATLAPKSSSWGRALSKTAVEVYKQSGKEIKIKIYYGAQQGDEEEMVKKIRLNQLDGGAFTGNGLGLLSEEVRVLELPGLFNNSKEVDYVYEKIEPKLNNYFRDNGFELVSLSETGFAYFFSKKNIKSVEDIRKTKMWIWKGDKLVYTFMNELDIPAVPVNFTEVVPSLQTGLIDGFYNTPTAAVSLQWYNEINTMLDLPMVNVTGGVVFSEQGWSKLSSSEQSMVRKVFKEQLEGLKTANRKSDAESIAIMKENGIKINASSTSIVDMRKTGEVIAKKLEDDMIPAALYDEVQNHLKAVR